VKVRVKMRNVIGIAGVAAAANQLALRDRLAAGDNGAVVRQVSV
jgi:hypothetical protein